MSFRNRDFVSLFPIVNISTLDQEIDTQLAMAYGTMTGALPLRLHLARSREFVMCWDASHSEQPIALWLLKCGLAPYVLRANGQHVV